MLGDAISCQNILMEDRTPAELHALAHKLTELRGKARELDLFTDDRELLSCVSCGLLEDVTVGGVLITYDGERSEVVDSGLRFSERQDGHFSCPRCSARVVTTRG